MDNWEHPEGIETGCVAFTKAVHVLFGIYLWEICMTGSFELSIFTGRRKLAWPLVIAMLFSLVGLVIFDHGSTKIDCGALYAFASVTANLTILSASTSLMIRAMEFWDWKRWAVLSMLILLLPLWAILTRTMLVAQASWDDQGGICVVVNTSHVLLIMKYIYIMAFDFVILVMTAIALRKRFRSEALSSFLFRDGLVYFLIMSTCNTVPVISAVLNLNNKMNVCSVAMVPINTISAIVAFRAVIRLHARKIDNRENTPNNPSMGIGASTLHLGHRSSPGLVSFLPSYKTMNPGVHIIAERIAMNRFGSSQSATRTNKSPYDRDEHDNDGTSINMDSKKSSGCDGDIHSVIQDVQLPPHIHFGSAV